MILSVALSFMAVAFAPGGTAAFAEGNCPEGYLPIGGANAGWTGCQPFASVQEGGERKPSALAGLQLHDPALTQVQVGIAAVIAAVVANARSMVDNMERLAALQNDPEYQK
jgi:hypothetical protein